MRLLPMVLMIGCDRTASVATQPHLAPPTFPSCSTEAMLEGIDVSTYQGEIDWQQVRDARIEFAFIRATHGLEVDSRFESNWAGARDASITRGAYQFFRPSQGALGQADLMLSTIGTLQPGDLPPVLDVESTDDVDRQALVDGVRTWVTRVKAATGRTPIIYTGSFFWRDHVAIDLSPSPLWHAQYTADICPRIAPSWSDWTIWQYSSKGHVAGIAGVVDLDRWRGDRGSLATFAGAP